VRRSGCGCLLRSLAAAAAAAFATVAVLVATGVLTGLDQWGVDRLMPLAGPPGESRSLTEAVVPLLHAPFHPAGVAVAQIVTLPGQVLVSLALVLVASRGLWRQGRVEAAVAWPAAWLLAGAVEIVFRHTLTRPALSRDDVHLVGFDSSWPSGHTLRAALVALALASAWP
jgi:membrane-associated phospholipid phosphatase